MHFSFRLLLYDTQRGNLAVLTEALVYCIVVLLHKSSLQFLFIVYVIVYIYLLSYAY